MKSDKTPKSELTKRRQAQSRGGPAASVQNSAKSQLETLDQTIRVKRRRRAIPASQWTNNPAKVRASINLPSKAYAEGKAWQHELSGQAHFDNVRRQRAANRLRVHNACQKARKVKERALSDVETAAACLVDDVSMSDSYVQIEIDNVEVPTDFVDFTHEYTRRKKRKLANKPWPLQKQALAAAELEGWGHDLPTSKAYVLITDRE